MNVNELIDEDVFHSHYFNMTQDRRQKIDRFRLAKDKRLSLGAGILLDKGLERMGIASRNITYKEHGKPYLCDRNDVFFNISHSGHVVICAFSDQNVGADIEQYRKFDDSLLHMICREEEISKIASLDVQPDMAYTKLWTIKESFIKYLGTGLSLSPKEIFVDLTPPVRVFCQKADCRGLSFTGFALENHAITICSRYELFAQQIEWIHGR